MIQKIIIFADSTRAKTSKLTSCFGFYNGSVRYDWGSFYSAIYDSLNKDGIFATNIADYKTYGKKEYKVVDDWINISHGVGFKHVSTIKMMLNTRPGVGNQKLAGREKWEGVYVFSK